MKMNTPQSIECNPNANWEAHAGVSSYTPTYLIQIQIGRSICSLLKNIFKYERL